MGKDEYLARLPDVDRKNILRIGELFEKAMKEIGREGALLAVGGTLTKPLPRKDIDILVVLEPGSSDPEQSKEATLYRRALAEFRILRGVIRTITREDPRFTIKKTIRPEIDELYGTESILKHDGSITVQPKAGVPIEFMRSPIRGVAEVIRQRQEPYVTIARLI